MEVNDSNITRFKWPVVVAVILFISFTFSFIFNVPLARQVLGFLYLTFVPGFLLLEILGAENLDAVETLCFSVGLSLAFLMILGLIINSSGPLFGISNLLSTTPIMIGITVSIFVLVIIFHFRGRTFELPKFEKTGINPLSVFIVCLPLLSIVGTYFVNISPSNNLVLLIMIVGIAIAVGLSFFERLVPSSLHPLLIVSVAVALLFHSSLISDHLIGFDVQHEYAFMRATVENSIWIPNVYDKFQVLMSVSILPAMYWDILNINGAWISKIVYPVIFSIVPLTLYKLYGIWLDKKTSFVAVFFLMANAIFFTEMLNLGRQMIAELFFVLLLVTLFSKKLSNGVKTVCFTAFSFGLINSHYGLAYIFLFLIILTFLISFVWRRRDAITKVKIYYVIIYPVLLFSWYIFIASSAAFNAILGVLNNAAGGFFSDFFSSQARDNGTLLGVGVGVAQTSSVINLLGRIFGYATEVIIILGFIFLLAKRKKIFDPEFLIFMSVSMLLLILSIILPNFVANLGMTRAYHIVLLSVSPLFLLGISAIAWPLSKVFFKRRRKMIVAILTLAILIPFFLFQTGFVYEVTKVQNYSIPLSSYRFSLEEYETQGLMQDQDVSGAQWLNAHYVPDTNYIYSDDLSQNILLTGGYGMIPSSNIRIIPAYTYVAVNGIFYLTWFSTHYGVVGNSGLNTTDYTNSTLESMNKIYSAGGCEVYFQP